MVTLMRTQNRKKPYGILIKMPENDPLAAPHLLGEGWTAERWFDSENARDEAYVGMLKNPGNYREGDTPSIVLTKIDPN